MRIRKIELKTCASGLDVEFVECCNRSAQEKALLTSCAMFGKPGLDSLASGRFSRKSRYLLDHQLSLLENEKKRIVEQ